jgi:hypothetical protein
MSTNVHTPDRPSNWTVPDGYEYAEMMDYYNVPYIGLRKIVKKRKTLPELWAGLRKMWAENEAWKVSHGVYNVPEMPSEFAESQYLVGREKEEGRV